MVSTIGIISLSSGIIGGTLSSMKWTWGPTTQRPPDSILSFTLIH